MNQLKEFEGCGNVILAFLLSFISTTALADVKSQAYATPKIFGRYTNTALCPKVNPNLITVYSAGKATSYWLHFKELDRYLNKEENDLWRPDVESLGKGYAPPGLSITNDKRLRHIGAKDPFTWIFYTNEFNFGDGTNKPQVCTDQASLVNDFIAQAKKNLDTTCLTDFENYDGEKLYFTVKVGGKTIEPTEAEDVVAGKVYSFFTGAASVSGLGLSTDGFLTHEGDKIEIGFFWKRANPIGKLGEVWVSVKADDQRKLNTFVRWQANLLIPNNGRKPDGPIYVDDMKLSLPRAKPRLPREELLTFKTVDSETYIQNNLPYFAKIRKILLLADEDLARRIEEIISTTKVVELDGPSLTYGPPTTPGAIAQNSGDGIIDICKKPFENTQKNRDDDQGKGRALTYAFTLFQGPRKFGIDPERTPKAEGLLKALLPLDLDRDPTPTELANLRAAIAEYISSPKTTFRKSLVLREENFFRNESDLLRVMKIDDGDTLRDLQDVVQLIRDRADLELAENYKEVLHKSLAEAIRKTRVGLSAVRVFLWDVAGEFKNEDIDPADLDERKPAIRLALRLAIQGKLTKRDLDPFTLK
jgi:hypothetical protein